MAMEKVESIEQLKELIAYVRNMRQGFVTNFYLDEEKHAAWIRTGEFQYDKWEDTVFLLFDHYAPDNAKYFTNMFYISTSEDAMLARLKEYPEKYIYDLYVLDIVGRDTMCLPLVEKLKAMRGYNDATLVRMTRINGEGLIVNGECVYATRDDVSLINELLHTHFDEQMEQLPLVEELEKMVEQKHVLLSMREGHVAGMLLFDLNATLYLRYWLVLPEYRNQGVGSELFRQFLWEGRETKQQILWVNQANENAIVRYEHYGFKKENMYDYIIRYC
jgi:GNAT superfamily N-acetyltransferase